MTTDLEQIATDIVDAAIKVHRELGPGLLESAYQHCHSHELRKRGRKVLNEVALPLVYDGDKIEVGYRIDAWVDNLIIVEHKTVEALLPIHEAQIITYLKLSNCKIGFLLNWNVILMKNGIKRVVYGLPEGGPYSKKPSRPSPLRG